MRSSTNAERRKSREEMVGSARKTLLDLLFFVPFFDELVPARGLYRLANCLD